MTLSSRYQLINLDSYLVATELQICRLFLFSGQLTNVAVDKALKISLLT